jgi:hypothetical protein
MFDRAQALINGPVFLATLALLVRPLAHTKADAL